MKKIITFITIVFVFCFVALAENNSTVKGKQMTVRRRLNTNMTKRQQAVCALAKIQSSFAESTITALVRALEDKDRRVRDEAIMGLSNIGKLSIFALKKALQNQNHLVRSAAAEALGKMHAYAAAPNLVEAFKDKDPNVRWAAAKAIERMGTYAFPYLIKSLKDKHWFAQIYAAKSLKNLGPAILTSLWCALEKDEALSDSIIPILKEMGPAAFPNLINALGHKNVVVRESATEALLGAGKEALEVLENTAVYTENLEKKWRAQYVYQQIREKISLQEKLW